MVDDTLQLREGSATRVSSGVGTHSFPDAYQREMPLLTRFVMKHGAGPQEAADAAHEAFATAYPQWDRIRFPKRWLRTVAVRVYLRARLREDLPGELPTTRAESHVPTNIQLSDQEREVYSALAELPSRQRQVMAWFYDGYTVAEIAEELEITKESVRQNLCRARATLKARLSGEGGVR
ncbi:RNA polymerase sigma factor [Streptomyces goshikiensis]|uniref:RNA polymerase sigma factor n=1 Tax=Streptomyces goshikiensis TaxID=1942 RepID=UPI0022F395AC|nr:sigma-70 family RNA polymerase sigma factor [Streptomyces goshikiensis]WBY24978.1 sigma-70 family RNA polymerase sigma factor [Streptomyces goshikiensis]